MTEIHENQGQSLFSTRNSTLSPEPELGTGVIERMSAIACIGEPRLFAKILDRIQRRGVLSGRAALGNSRSKRVLNCIYEGWTAGLAPIQPKTPCALY